MKTLLILAAASCSSGQERTASNGRTHLAIMAQFA